MQEEEHREDLVPPEESHEPGYLNLQAVIGFNGTVVDGLILHPDNETIIFPIGNQIVVRNVLKRQDQFLKGHSNYISAITLSSSGRYLASGQKTYSGFKADIIIWDLQIMSLIHRFSIHKYYIQSLSFSHDEKYLVSLGGAEDNYLIVWDVETGKAICGNAAGTDVVHQVKYFNTTNAHIITCQNYGIRIWTVEYVTKKLTFIDVNFGNLKRQILCLCIDPYDKNAYCGTKSGDILEIDLVNGIYKRIGPVKRLFPQGVNCIRMLPNSDILIGTRDGLIAKVSYTSFKVKVEGKVLGGVTSMALTADSAYFFCGTEHSNIYWIETSSLKNEIRNTCHNDRINDVQFPIRNTCHNDRINDVQFPYEYSGVFGTCGKEDIRIWNSETRQEHLRIHVPNLECYCFGFMRDGKSIYSGWHDGKIRTFLPQSGKLLYCINEAHINGVTAITATSDCRKIVSGSDGSCIEWDISNYTRVACLFETTMFKQLVYHPDESQILTTGTDKKITYWDVIDSNEIRSIDGSYDGEINTIAICKSGEYFITAGEDKQITIWDYDLATPKWKGIGHSNGINRIAIAPNQEFIVSVGQDGSIFIFETPKEIRLARKDMNMPQ